MRTNHVLVDYENVQPTSLTSLVGDHPFKVLLFVGANQAKVSFEVAEAMQALGSNANYIKSVATARMPWTSIWPTTSAGCPAKSQPRSSTSSARTPASTL